MPRICFLSYSNPRIFFYRLKNPTVGMELGPMLFLYLRIILSVSLEMITYVFIIYRNNFLSFNLILCFFCFFRFQLLSNVVLQSAYDKFSGKKDAIISSEYLDLLEQKAVNYIKLKLFLYAVNQLKRSTTLIDDEELVIK